MTSPALRFSEAHFLFLGRVGRPRGLDGSFFVVQRVEALPSLKTVYIKNKANEMLALACLRCSLAGGKPVMRLAAVGDRNAAEAWRDVELFMKREDLPFDPKHEYLWEALIGRAVVDCEGLNIGKVRRIENHQAHDILVIEQGAQCCDVPMVTAYLDMSFEPLRSDQPLQLTVAASCFEDLWYEDR